MEHLLELTDELEILEEIFLDYDEFEALTLELEDELDISKLTVSRSGNNINMYLYETVEIEVSLDGAYKIKRAGDIAFIRTNYP